MEGPPLRVLRGGKLMKTLGPRPAKAATLACLLAAAVPLSASGSLFAVLQGARLQQQQQRLPGRRRGGPGAGRPRFARGPAARSGAEAVASVGAGAAACAALLLAGRRRRCPCPAPLPLQGAPGVRAAAPLTVCRALQTGIVGLPNVGKSTMFNALCGSGQAESANYPFCTIDPNIAKAVVPDERLQKLADMAQSQKVIPEVIEYVDIAGLVRGASKGEGLGNKFLGNIRNVDAIVHVVRCFEDDEVTHVDDTVDPARDIETITLELILSDLDQCERRIKKLARDVLGKVPGAKEEKDVLEKIVKALEDTKPARTVKLDASEEESIRQLGFLTKKPVIYAANVGEDELAKGNHHVEAVREAASLTGDKVVVVSAQVEAELGDMDAEERAEYLESLGVTESGCESLVQETYKLLGLRTYFTCGPQETRAWTIREGWKAPKAAGVIHTDFEKGFIKAETILWEELLQCGSEAKAKEAGKLRIEGKDYVVQEGDVMHFRFSN